MAAIAGATACRTLKTCWETKVVVICSIRSRNWSADTALFRSSVGLAWLFPEELVECLGLLARRAWPKNSRVFGFRNYDQLRRVAFADCESQGTLDNFESTV